MSGNRTTETRSIVLEILLEATAADKDVKANILIRDVLQKYDYMDTRDKAFIKCLAEGCIEQQLKLDYLIEYYANTKKGKIKPVIRNILRMGIYQILEMDSVPDSAACNEAVKLATQKGFSGLKGFVNGVLRRIVREKTHLPWPEKIPGDASDCALGNIKYYSVFYSMPEWLIRMWLEQLGEERMVQVLEGISQKTKVTIHLRDDMQPAEKQMLLLEMERQGYAPTPHAYLPYAFTLDKVGGVMNVPGFTEGQFIVQDVSSMLAIECTGITPGMQILDVCAAPGGKSVHAAWKTGENGLVSARDLYEEKTWKIMENRDRLNLSHLQVKEWDALIPDPEWKERADLVIADLPCSGLGIIGRKGDIRYHVTPEQIQQLADLQRQILKVVISYVKPGGYLLFSTCTISREENENNRQWILGTELFTPVDFSKRLPRALTEDSGAKTPFGEPGAKAPAEEPGVKTLYGEHGAMPEAKTPSETAREGYLQLLPGVHLTDGFFFSLYRKKIEN